MDRVLGQTPGLVSCGEIFNWWQNFANPAQKCSCAKLVSECDFWREVHARAFPTPPDIDAEWRAQRSATAIRRSRLRPLPGSFQRGPDAAQTHVAEMSARLYRAVLAVSGASMLVDSSKRVGYGVLLARSPEFDVRMVHMVRDPRAVEYSRSFRKFALARPLVEKGLRKGGGSGPQQVWEVNLFAELARLNRVPTITVKYEDFARDPSLWSARILQFAGIEGRPVGLSTGSLDLQTVHMADGNPGLRFKTGLTALRVDDEWRAKLPARRKAKLTALTWPLLLRYRYPLWP